MEASKRPQRPRDPAQLAKAIVDEATGQVPPAKDGEKVLTERHAIAGRIGGKKGGKARAAKLTPGQRSEIAQRAARTRWAKHRV